MHSFSRLSLAALILLVFAPTASAKIFYTCGTGDATNICSVSDSGTDRKTIARGGFAPTASKSGKRIAYVQMKTGKLVIANGSGKKIQVIGAQTSISVMLPKLNARGTKVAWSEISYIYYPYTTTIPYGCTAKVGSSAKPDCDGTWSGHFGWTAGGNIMGAHDRNLDEICRLDEKGNATGGSHYDSCVGPMLIREETPTHLGYRPDMVGTKLVNTTTPEVASNETPKITTYRASSGKAIKVIARGDDPVFSPDGSQVAFDRGDYLYRVSASGGRAKRLVKGSYPAWSR
jgi:hypothetical protein